ncbi:ATP-binding protein, partial [Lacticaseibacillus rhamnosus]
AAGVGSGRLETTRLAASEALTNVVLHAYRDGEGGGRIDVVAALASSELWVLVADDGCGLHPRADSPGLGMGLALIAAISEFIEMFQTGVVLVWVVLDLPEARPAPAVYATTHRITQRRR